MRIVVDGLPYPVIIATNGAPEVVTLLSSAGSPAALVADAAVDGRGKEILSRLKASGCEIRSEHTIVAGERHKRWRSVAQLHERWLASDVDRQCIAVAVGGGTTTDVVGFAAATYLRGIRWLPVATTMVGMVDAAIGGKTGVDLPQGKNLIGALWQPIGSVADLTALDTLGAKPRSEGVAEMVKAAIVGDPGLLERIEGANLGDDADTWGELVARAAAVKARVVAADPDDRGSRAVLNLGHTFAHALEHASRYRIKHGAAVALGLRAAGILARDRTGWSQADQRKVGRVLRRHRLPTRTGKLDATGVLEAMRLDKKRRSGTLRFVLPVRLGEVIADVEVPDRDVVGALEELGHAPARNGY